MHGYGKNKFPEGEQNLTEKSIMSIKPKSTDKEMWIYYTTDATVNFLDVSTTYCGHFQGGVFEGYVTDTIKTKL